MESVGLLSNKKKSSKPWTLMVLGSIAVMLGLCFFCIPKPRVILISIDGFRPDYLKWTPTLEEMAHRGTKSSLIPSFPSITFPNHYTLVTGRYPESHGIIGNVFHDASINRTFSYRNPKDNQDSYWWRRAEPIWTTATKLGKKVGVCMWPGSEAPFQGIVPAVYLNYTDKMTPKEKVDIVLEWARQDFDLMLMYLPEVDHQGHAGGVESTHGVLKQVDDAIATLLKGLPGSSRFHIIIVSDHGMTDLSKDRMIPTSAIVDDTSKIIYENLVLGLTETPLKQGAHFEMFKKEQRPQLHFSGSDLIPPVLAVPEVGWSIQDEPLYMNGAHGYNPRDPSMHAIFLSNHQLHVPNIFDNVNVYSILCHLLHIRPLSHNGTAWTTLV